MGKYTKEEVRSLKKEVKGKKKVCGPKKKRRAWENSHGDMLSRKEFFSKGGRVLNWEGILKEKNGNKRKEMSRLKP